MKAWTGLLVLFLAVLLAALPGPPALARTSSATVREPRAHLGARPRGRAFQGDRPPPDR